MVSIKRLLQDYVMFMSSLTTRYLNEQELPPISQKVKDIAITEDQLIILLSNGDVVRKPCKFRNINYIFRISQTICVSFEIQKKLSLRYYILLFSATMRWCFDEANECITSSCNQHTIQEQSTLYMVGRCTTERSCCVQSSHDVN